MNPLFLGGVAWGGQLGFPWFHQLYTFTCCNMTWYDMIRHGKIQKLLDRYRCWLWNFKTWNAHQKIVWRFYNLPSVFTRRGTAICRAPKLASIPGELFTLDSPHPRRTHGFTLFSCLELKQKIPRKTRMQTQRVNAPVRNISLVLLYMDVCKYQYIYI